MFDNSTVARGFHDGFHPAYLCEVPSAAANHFPKACNAGPVGVPFSQGGVKKATASATLMLQDSE